MKQIEVTASRNYTVTVGSDLLRTIGALTRQITKAETICVVSDSNVWPIYGQTVCESLEKAGYSVCNFQFLAGEKHKNSTTCLQLLNFLAENKLTRSDCIIALGGGVVGDLAGFAAATYLRGIPYIQVPTTLLAMVDSSVGGKTAIDLEAGKNLAGAFYQPAAVLCDLDTLNTLPKDTFLDGCAEVIKYGILYDEALFAHLEQMGPGFDRERVIARCIECKRDVVAMDEFDTGARMKLNLGHTIGHAVEKCSNFSISHGQAVAIGMAVVSRASQCADTRRILSLLEAFGLPTTTEFSAKLLYTSALSDKKRSGGHIHLIVPRTIGHCDIVTITVENLQAFIEEGL